MNVLELSEQEIYRRGALEQLRAMGILLPNIPLTPILRKYGTILTIMQKPCVKFA